MSMADTPQIPLSLQLRDESTFDNYVAGANGAALSALRALPASPGQVWLWGSEGLGRTHLVEATVREALGQGMGAMLLDGRTLESLSPAVLEGLEQFGLVAIDDVDVLAGNAAWEEALFHCYNRLRDAGGRLLVTASAPPSGAGFRLPDLASRWAAGPVFALRALSDEDLLDLLMSRAGARGLTLSTDTAQFVVARSDRRPAGLVAQLDRLDKAALAHQRRLTIPFIKRATGW